MNTIEIIFNLCKLNNIQQKDLAEAIGIRPSALSDWKKGNYKPKVEIISRIADYFNVSTDYLLGRTDDPTPPQKRTEKPEEKKYVLSVASDGKAMSTLELNEDQLKELDRFMDKLKKEGHGPNVR